ncbi:right-handed parallel beta-helix repeat-containing protein [Enterobacter roggenkampii]|nr:right-handed parallel beta-helix repeat-containing protein [Enterobacter roggenkampii]
MADIIPNVVVTNPRPIFTDSRTFRAVANGRIYIGEIDTDPTIPSNQIPVYVQNEDGSTVQIPQPLVINAAGKIVYGGQVVKVVTVKGHSMAVYDAYGTQVDYIADVLKYDPDQFKQQLEDQFADGSFPETVKYKHGLPATVDGAVMQTVQEKLDGFVFLEDFGGKDDNGVTDNSLAFQKAFAAGERRIYLKGSGVYAMKTRDIELPDRYFITSATQKAEIKYLGSDTTFSMFTLTGSGPASNQWKNGGTFENVIISSNVMINWLVGRHVQNIDFNKVFFYSVTTSLNNYHYVYFTRCELWGSPFNGRSDLNTTTFISESPKFNLCFVSNSPIDAWDTADVTLTSCTVFAGSFAVRTRNTLSIASAPDQVVGYPVVITGNVFDAVNGAALELYDIAYATITGNFVSCGRANNTNGVYIKGGRSCTITGNTFTYCGNFGLFLENVKQTAVAGNQYNGNKNGGLGLNGCDAISVTGGSAGTSYVRGGYYVQPIGVSDVVSNSTNVLIIGMAFDAAMTDKYFLDTSIVTGNRVIACAGVPDSVFGGGTSSRPTIHGYGQPYYDTTLGKPIWWNSTTGTWKDAMGNDV